MTIDTFSKDQQELYRQQYHNRFPDVAKSEVSNSGVETFVLPHGYNDTVDHFKNFFQSVRTGAAPVEDAVFGFRAAGAALLSNLSMERQAPIHWNPETMKVG